MATSQKIEEIGVRFLAEAEKVYKTLILRVVRNAGSWSH
jgi:hypothetical protein